MDSGLKLTRRERVRHVDWDEGDRRGVWPRAVANVTTFNTANPVRTLSFQADRRSRLHRITWAGDVNALRVHIRRGDGELLTRSSCHIPSISGASVHDNRSSGALFPAAQMPLAAASVANVTTTAWDFVIEPNLVLEKGSFLYVDCSLNNPTDVYILAAGTWTLHQTLWLYEFPDWRDSDTGGGTR